MTTAPPAAIPGSVPTAQRCRSHRGLALRVVPLAWSLDEHALRDAYWHGGRTSKRPAPDLTRPRRGAFRVYTLARPSTRRFDS